jgi:SET domain-containing protein
MYKIKHSKIHGVGVFSTQNIQKDTVIGIPLYCKYWIFPIITPDLGKKINHSFQCNAFLQKDNNELKWYLVANKDIKKNEEITINYNDAPWFIDGPMPWYT